MCSAPFYHLPGLLDILLRVYCVSKRLLNFGGPSILQCGIENVGFHAIYAVTSCLRNKQPMFWWYWNLDYNTDYLFTIKFDSKLTFDLFTEWLNMLLYS